MNSHFAVIAGAFLLALSGFANIVSDLLSFIAVTTAACTGFARYTAVLLNFKQAQIERATAAGFFCGLAISLIILLLDRL